MDVNGIMGSLGIDGRLTQFGFMQFRIVDAPVSSYQLLMMGGGLLFVAAVLLGIQQRRAAVVVDNSPFQHELISYLSRIANALERMEAQAPNVSGQAAADVLRRLVNASTSSKLREMPKYRSK
jgi:hypothetical protein